MATKAPPRRFLEELATPDVDSYLFTMPNGLELLHLIVKSLSTSKQVDREPLTESVHKMFTPSPLPKISVRKKLAVCLARKMERVHIDKEGDMTSSILQRSDPEPGIYSCNKTGSS